MHCIHPSWACVFPQARLESNVERLDTAHDRSEAIRMQKRRDLQAARVKSEMSSNAIVSGKSNTKDDFPSLSKDVEVVGGLGK